MRMLVIISVICSLLVITALGTYVLQNNSGGRHQPRGGFALAAGDSDAQSSSQNVVTWKTGSVPLGEYGSIMLFGDDGLSVIAGIGTILISHDDGKTWTALKGGRGEYRVTSDGGITYALTHGTKRETPNYVDANDLCGVENGIITPSGRLYLRTICEHTTQVWSVPLKNESDPWYALAFTYDKDPTLGVYTPISRFVLAGNRVLTEAMRPDRAAILTTDDNGITWRPFWNNPFWGAGLAAYDFIDASNGWLLSGSGKLSRTTDGGRTWTPLSTLSGDWAEQASSMKFASANKGFIVGSGGLILTTKDGGNTWQRQKSGTKSALFQVVVGDEKHVWASGNTRTVLESTDGGVTWSRAELGVNYGVYYRLTAKNNTAWVVSERNVFSSR